MKSDIKQLQELYHTASKHSNYQVLASQLTKYFKDEPVEVTSRHEQPRLDCILSNLNLQDRRVLDIGGNTGFFTFESLNAGASKAYYCEGNRAHANFVALAAKILGYAGRVDILNRYFAFDGTDIESQVDVCLLLNVLHHVGDDYGDSELSVDNAKKEILRSLNAMAAVADTLVFQLGFCWKGDRHKALFQNGTKKEMIEFITEGVSGIWNIESIHIPEVIDGQVVYRPLSSLNILRQDGLGEFLNRPLFIMNRVG